MHKPLGALPVFPKEAFVARISSWKKLATKPGEDRVIVEWGIGRGPKVVVYPATDRGLGFDLLTDLSAPVSDERWADFLELSYVPEVLGAIESAGQRGQAICADQRPIQTMRQRRREHEKLAHARSGGGAHA
jgi:hypothetical protein